MNKEKIKEFKGLCDKGASNKEIKLTTGLSEAQIAYWKKKLREAGYSVTSKMGRPSLDLSDLQ